MSKVNVICLLTNSQCQKNTTQYDKSPSFASTGNAWLSSQEKLPVVNASAQNKLNLLSLSDRCPLEVIMTKAKEKNQMRSVYSEKVCVVRRSGWMDESAEHQAVLQEIIVSHFTFLNSSYCNHDDSEKSPNLKQR